MARRRPNRSTGADSSLDPADETGVDFDDLDETNTEVGAEIEDTAKASAHRPSRRHLIVQAAVRVFARKGFAEASIQEIAEEADMVPTAVYYHFSSKDELFENALGYAMDASSNAAYTARPDDASGDAETFKRVVESVWDWTALHPNASRLLFLQMAGGATPNARLLAKEYEERHVRRAFDYFPITEIPVNKRAAAAQHAIRTLRVRAMIGMTIAIQPLRLEGGPLAAVATPRLRAATTDICTKMIEGR